MIAHSRIGYNSDPSSKIFGFSNYMDNLSLWSPDVAMFKYCYVDISKKTHIERLFSEYKNRMDKLKVKYPDTTFVHVTAPLTTIQTGLKAEIKNLLGKPLAGYEENIVRNKYNDLLRSAYEDSEPIFDLAEIQSTLPDRSRSKFEAGGVIIWIDPINVTDPEKVSMAQADEKGYDAEYQLKSDNCVITYCSGEMQNRYCTWDEAALGHKYVVHRVEEAEGVQRHKSHLLPKRVMKNSSLHC